MNRKFALLLVVLSLCLSACTETAVLEEEPAPYAGLPEMVELTTCFSGSSWGSEFGDVEIGLNWHTDKYQWAEFTGCYLEYSDIENGVFERVVPREELGDMLDGPERLEPDKSCKIKVDVDSFYDHCDYGYYRLAIVFDAKSYNGKNKEFVAYIDIGGNDFE